MRELKRFSELSRRQKNRRLKHMQISENFVSENVNTLNLKANNHLLDQEIIDHDPEFVLDNNTCNKFFENVTTNAAMNQSNIVPTHNSTFSISSKRKHLFSNNKQISLREKLILWTDEHKTEQKSSSSLLRILRSEGHNHLPKDSRTLMKTPRFTILYKKSGGHYYHYGLQNGLIDQLKQFNMLISNNVIYINVNIDGLPIAKSSKSQLWPILAQIVSENSKPFIAYHGYSKPTSSNNFLQHFVEELKQLSTIGFTYENNKYYVKIRAIICDSPARSFVTYTKGHNGYFGCSKCVIEGDNENRQMLFLEKLSFANR